MVTKPGSDGDERDITTKNTKKETLNKHGLKKPPAGA
jgi:hypothetical protein